MPLGFIRYFAVTNGSEVGAFGANYLLSLLRLAPVRLVSTSGLLEGVWRRYETLLMTPMTGTCVSCVCTHPSSWIEDMAVPMPAQNLGAQGAAMTDSAPKTAGTARGVRELYTPPGKTVLRNVLFMVEPPKTDAQRQTAARYEAVVIPPMVADDQARFGFGAKLMQEIGIGRVYVATSNDHTLLRLAVLGHKTDPSPVPP